MKLLVTLFLFLATSAFSQDVDELLEEGNFEDAAVTLKEKISEGPVEIEDILLLGRIYEGLGFNKKAIKSYLFGIKKLHSSAWKDIKTYKSLKEVLPDLREPPKNVLLLAYKVGVHYYDLYLTSEASEDFNRRILETSLKYLLICDRFRFNEAKTKYFLGLVFKEYEDYEQASMNFLDSWELFEKKKRLDKVRDQKIRLMVGESFVNYGHIEAGTNHLRSVYYYKDGSRSLRNYAAEYLNEFKGTNVGGSVALSVGNDSNAIFGNSTGTEQVKASRYISRSASLFLGHAPSFSSAYNFSLGFTDELYSESTLKDNDSRSINFTSSWDYKKFENTILNLSYFFTKNYARPTATEEFDPESDTHQVSIGWTYVIRKAIVSISLPISSTQYEDGTSTQSKTVSFAWEKISFSNYWSPRLSLDVSLQEEGVGFEDSKSVLFGFTNSMTFSDTLSGSVDLTFEKNSNSSESLAFTETSFGVSVFYTFENVEGLGAEVNLTTESNSPSSGTSDSRFKSGFGLNYFL